jgi:uncharacterized protein
VVHLLNNLFKVALIGRQANWRVVLKFGLPAIVAAFAGAWVLQQLAQGWTPVRYQAFGREFIVEPVNILVGFLLLLFSAVELSPRLSAWSFPPRYLIWGGALSGFFGGLAGMQGALRSAFLLRLGLKKEAFIATGVIIACLIDITRLSVYFQALRTQAAHFNYLTLGAAVGAACVGALLGQRFLHKITIQSVQRIVAVMLFATALGLLTGVL